MPESAHFDVVEINCDPTLTDEAGALIPVNDPRRQSGRPFSAKEKRIQDQGDAEGEARVVAEKADREQRTKDAAALKERAKSDPDLAALVRLLRV